MKYCKSILITIFVFFNVSCSGFVDYNFVKGKSYNVAVIGTGYVGLIAGSGLAEIGHRVICADIDKDKINILNNGQMPIFEPGLSGVVKKNYDNKRLFFTDDVSSAIRNSDIIIIAVGTPMGKNGKANLFALKSVIRSIGENLNGYKVICTKSTVPVGTNNLVKSLLTEYSGESNFDIVSNPEFLRAGSAVKDFFERNPIVLGSDSEKALEVMKDLYSPLIKKGLKLITSNLETAETIKYAWNSFSAIRIGYTNELSRFCQTCGADVFKVIQGMSLSEDLLPSKKLRPGPGIGGSCLPKDTSAFVDFAKKLGVDLAIVRASIESNEKQKNFVIKLLYDLLDGSVKGKTIGILGLSFKPNTDDIRMTPAIPLIEQLLNDSAYVKAYDPKAMDNVEALFPEVEYCSSVYDVFKGCNAVVVLTDWSEFKSLDFDRIEEFMAQSIIVDGRNMFDPSTMQKKSFRYTNLGRV